LNNQPRNAPQHQVARNIVCRQNAHSERRPDKNFPRFQPAKKRRGTPMGEMSNQIRLAHFALLCNALKFKYIAKGQFGI
jgi:hypothetical protein